MTKKICSFLTLFVLFFAMFIGLGTSNYSVIKAAGDQASVEADFEAIDKSFPETAYISFPVTYKSVFGNEITWFVEEGQSFVVHDLVAQWMVVTRPTLQDEEVDVTVVIKGEDNASKTHTFKLKVPAGTTTVPSYDIEYLNEDGSDFVFTEEVKRTYDLGEASFNLPVPTKAGYTFDGWYDGETKVERILVGSMKDYSLKAKWTLITYALTDEGVTLSNDELTYNASEQKPTVTVKYGETTLTEGTDYTVEYDEDVINQGIKSVVVTGKGIYTGTITKTYTIKKADLVLEAKTGKEAVYGDNLPTWSIADFTATYQGNDTSEVLNGELIVSYNVDAPKNVGEYTVSFSGIEADNYNVTIKDSTLNITKKDLVLSTEEKVINFGAELPTWVLSGEFEYEENVSALGGNLVVTYKDSQEEVVTPSVIGTYTVSFSGYTSDNYSISYTPTTLTIADAKVMFVVSDTETTYNGDKQMFTVVVKKTEGNQEVIENANVTYICNDKAFDGATDANTYSVTISFSDPELGAISNEVSFVIKAREITLTANASESVYGEAVKTPSYVVTSGEILEKDLEGLAIEVNVNDITDLTIPGTYKDKVSVSFTENTNYNITTDSNDYTVTKRTVKVAADDKSSAYSDEIVNLTYQFVTEEGFYSVLESDLAELQALISILTDATNESNVGTYDITFTINESGKYVVEVENGTYVITQKSIDAAEILLSGSDFNVKAGTDKPSLTLKLGETVIDASLYNVAYTNTTMGENAIQTATVTVTIREGGNYTGTVSKDYQLTSEGIAKIDADLIKAEYQQILTGSFETVDVNQLDVQGTNGSVISWMSDNTAVSVDSEGNVTIVRPVGSDAEVKLTAMIVYGNGSSVASCEFEFTVLGEYTLANQDSSVVIEGIASTYELNAVEVTYDEDSTFAVFDNEEYVIGYDISFNLGDEENVQPATTVTVKIEIPEEYLNDETLKVYHVNSDNSLTEVKYNIVGSYAVFEANEFSPYILTVKKPVEMYFTNGQQIVISTVRSSGNYFIMSGNLDDKDRLIAIDSEYSNPSEIKVLDNTYVWTIIIENNNYYLKNFENKYVSWKSDSAVILVDDINSSKALTVVQNEDSTFNFSFMASETERLLSLNNTSGNDYFCFYKSGQKSNLVICEPNYLTDNDKLERITISEKITDSIELPEGFVWTVVSGTGISIENNVATVTQAEVEQTVVLQAALNSATREFTITIAAMESSEPDPEEPAVGIEKIYTYTFTKSQYSANGTKDLGGINWTLSGDGGYWGFDSTKGQQLGSGSKPYKTLTFNTEDIKGTIKKITINTSGASSINGSFTVTVGGTQYGSSTKLTTTATDYIFEGESSGEIIFNYTQTSSKAIYIKSIEITYVE